MPQRNIPERERRWRRYAESLMLGMRNNRYSWWTHGREIADYFIPRRYKWVITPNQQNRGSPINQHLIDSTPMLASYDLAAGLMSGKTSPQSPWFGLRIGNTDSASTSSVSIWLAQVEYVLRLIFQESNFYPCIAQWFQDLVNFGTAVLLIYEDFDNVILCRNPCFGEYYVDLDGKWRPRILGLEYTMTVRMIVEEFGYDNCSASIQNLWDISQGSGADGSSLTREITIGQLIEPNDDGKNFFDQKWAFRECFWEWGGSASPQDGGALGLLRQRGYHEQPNVTCRWYLTSNDPYGRSPAMDALGDAKQLQLESKRKAQAIDKMVNPPLVADIQLKNKPASLLPGGMTYVTGFTASGKPGIASVYDSKFPVGEITEDLNEIRERIKATFYNHLFRPISQYETRSNITAVEIEQRRAESLIMLGPVFERLDNEGLRPIIERTYAIASRAGILPPPPPEIAGQEMNIKFTSMLTLAQNSIQAAAMQEVLSLVGGLAGVDPSAMDTVDVDYTVARFSTLKGNDPRMIRTPQALAQLRADRAKQQAQAQIAEQAQQLSAGAKTLSDANIGGGQNALQALTSGVQ